MYPDIHLLASKLITVGEVRVTTEDPRTPPMLTFFLPLTKIGLLLMARFPSTLKMASSKTTSQALRRRSPGLFTHFHKKDTAAQPSSQLGGHPPRVTSSLSLTRINRNRELNTYARMQSKNTKDAQILHSQISPRQQMLGCD
jgi:hypothetical protein